MVRIDNELARIREILREHRQGMSVTEIARLLDKNKHSVGRYLDVLRASGQVEMRSFGMAKVFTLAKRLPVASMLSITSEPILVLDEEGRVTEANDAAVGLIGLPRERVLGQRLMHLPAPDPRILDLVGHLAEAAANSTAHDEIHLEGEDERWYWYRIVPMVFEQGERGTVLILGDMTEHRRAEIALTESEALFRGLAENVQDGILISRDDEIVFVNRRATEILGYTREELNALDHLEFIAPEESERVHELFERHLRTGEVPDEFRFWARHKDGTDRYLRARFTVVRSDGRLNKYIVLTDETEARLAEEELQKQMLFVRHIMNEFPHPIYAIDRNGVFVGCNQAFAGMFGRERNAIPGLRVDDLIPPGDRPSFTATDRDVFDRAGESLYCTTLGSSRGPRRVLVRKMAFRAGAEGDLVLIGVIFDPPEILPLD